MSKIDKHQTLIQKERQAKQKNDKVHFFISSALVLMSYLFWSDFATFRRKAPEIGIEMRPLSDFWYIALAAVVLHLLRRVIDLLLRKKMEVYLLRESLIDLDLRKDKLTRQIFDAIYYFSVFVYGRIIASGTDYIPSCYGGAGTCDSLGMYWPRMRFTEQIRWYVIVQFGHHLHNLVYHTVAMKNVGNYFEMITHHYAAVVSLFYSYFTNWEDYAFIVLISHDLSDGFLNFGKVLRDIGWGSSIAMYVNFALLAFYWFYHRAIIVASCYFYKTSEYFWWKNPFPAYEDLWLSVKRGVNFIVFNIFLIWIMNIFWWSQIVKIGINKFIKKRQWVSQHEGEIDPEELENKQQASKPSHNSPSTPLAVDPAPDHALKSKVE